MNIDEEFTSDPLNKCWGFVVRDHDGKSVGARAGLLQFPQSVDLYRGGSLHSGADGSDELGHVPQSPGVGLPRTGAGSQQGWLQSFANWCTHQGC
jgi:hypothetical protein